MKRREIFKFLYICSVFGFTGCLDILGDNQINASMIGGILIGDPDILYSDVPVIDSSRKEIQESQALLDILELATNSELKPSQSQYIEDPVINGRKVNARIEMIETNTLSNINEHVKKDRIEQKLKYVEYYEKDQNIDKAATIIKNLSRQNYPNPYIKHKNKIIMTTYGKLL